MRDVVVMWFFTFVFEEDQEKIQMRIGNVRIKKHRQKSNYMIKDSIPLYTLEIGTMKIEEKNGMR